jgi:hypothetical protein
MTTTTSPRLRLTLLIDFPTDQLRIEERLHQFLDDVTALYGADHVTGRIERIEPPSRPRVERHTFVPGDDQPNPTICQECGRPPSAHLRHP